MPSHESSRISPPRRLPSYGRHMGCFIVAIWIIALSIAAVLASTGGFGIVLAIAVVLAAGVLHFMISATNGVVVSKPHPPSPPVVKVPVAGSPARLSSAGRQAVSGEYYHQSEIRAAVAGGQVGRVGDWETGLARTAYLVREPTNKHDRNAVAVRLPHDEGTVLAGYLPAAVAPAWHPLLKELEARGEVAECVAHISGTEDGNFQVVLWVPEPGLAAIQNSAPAGASLLEARRSCALTGEQAFQDELSGYQLGRVWATLHQSLVSAGKSKGQPTLEARIDGKRVGMMTAVQGLRYASLLAGGPVACEAEVFEGPRHREVSLMLPRVD